MKYVFILLVVFLGMEPVFAQSFQILEAPVRLVNIFSTADSTEYRMSLTEQVMFRPHGQPFENEPCIFLDSTKRFQTFVGIGGAFTDASAETYAKLPADKQAEFMQAYFDPKEGIGYTIGRTTIHSSDFSSGSYTYVKDGDKDLKTFSIAHDEQFRIPFIKKAIAAAGGDLPIFASPWSPPAWMKDNDNMLQGGKLLPDFYQSWANYYVKFINAYEKAGIPIWGLTVQNEPMAKQTWESCIYTATEERDFIKNFLGPTLHKNGLQSKKLIAWDHNRDLLFQRASTILNDPEAAKYVWGIGFHWYESWTGAPTPENVKLVSESFSNKPLLLTEACNFPFSWKTIDEWHWGENYGTAMISDFNNGAVAWTDWNLLLDETGGPNHVKNFCFAPIIGDTRNGTLHYMNAYYYIGHFSRYIRPGARRIACSSNRAQLQTTAFLNPDGSIAVVVMNAGKTGVDYKLFAGDQAIDLKILPHSIQTLVF
ncbi:MAG: glycoside hydrolase family 30 protein [Lewinellaceae bacterium]|nr:glycoside hydrolase family 30 protein [Lewinellaceae bacterium]